MEKHCTKLKSKSFQFVDLHVSTVSTRNSLNLSIHCTVFLNLILSFSDMLTRNQYKFLCNLQGFMKTESYSLKKHRLI